MSQKLVHLIVPHQADTNSNTSMQKPANHSYQQRVPSLRILYPSESDGALILNEVAFLSIETSLKCCVAY